MSLGDAFPEDYKEASAKRSLTIGNVIKFFVLDTTPHKEKRFIIVGISKDGSTLATVYINSEREFYPPGRKRQLLPLKSKGRDYLDWDSLVDCSDLKLKNYKDLLSKIINRPGAVLGTISTKDFDDIKTKIISSPTITPIDKKEYGFFV